MLAAPLPPEESERLAALYALELLDTAPEERFDRFTRLAQRLFDAPIAVISLVDTNREWYKARRGVPISEGPRDISFCGHAILRDEPLIIPTPWRTRASPTTSR